MRSSFIADWRQAKKKDLAVKKVEIKKVMSTAGRL
jgi:hypothetical protein